MNVLNGTNTMQGYFTSQWASATPIRYPDDPRAVPNEPWVRMIIKHDSGDQATMGDPGNNRFRRTGVITFQIFQQEGQYGTIAKSHAKDIMAIYTGTTNSDIMYINPILREVGNDGHGWYQVNVVVKFQYDEIT